MPLCSADLWQPRITAAGAPWSNSSTVENQRNGGDLRVAMAGCVVLLLAAWGGAWWDETSRAGWSTWVSLCRNGSPGWFTVLRLYAWLMPASLLALLGAGLVLVAVAAGGSPGRARGGLAGHAACLLAMPVAIYGCALAAGAAASVGAQFAAMALADLGLTLGLVPVALRVLRPAHRDGGVAGPAAG